MKKIFSVVLAVMASIFFCNAALAKNADALQTNKMTAIKAGASTAVCDAYPTCITVTNKSSYTIYITVPTLSMSMSPLNPNYLQPLQSVYYYANLQVVLYDWAGRLFYNSLVPNHWDVPVYDRAGKLTAQAQPK